MVLSILTAVTGIAGGWFKDRAAIKKAQVKAKIKEIESTGAANKSADEIALKNMEKSWKDELVLIVFLIPAILAFFPQYQGIVQAGFIALNSMPDWYKLILTGIIATIYGLRWLIQPVMAIVMKRFS